MIRPWLSLVFFFLCRVVVNHSYLISGCSLSFKVVGSTMGTHIWLTIGSSRLIGVMKRVSVVPVYILGWWSVGHSGRRCNICKEKCRRCSGEMFCQVHTCQVQAWAIKDCWRDAHCSKHSIWFFVGFPGSQVMFLLFKMTSSKRMPHRIFLSSSPERLWSLCFATNTSFVSRLRFIRLYWW